MDEEPRVMTAREFREFADWSNKYAKQLAHLALVAGMIIGLVLAQLGQALLQAAGKA